MSNADSEGSGMGDPTRSLSIILFHQEVLDCPICLQPLSSPIYQCENGHVMCSSCYSNIKIQKICPSCAYRVGSNRCLAMEKVVESIIIACSNKPHGCLKTTNYCNRLAHEKMCHYTRCWCPHSGCDYVGSWNLLNQHFWNKHPSAAIHIDFDRACAVPVAQDAKYVFLQEKKEKIVTVMTQHVESRGSLCNIVCIAPTVMKNTFSYDVRVIKGESEISVKAPMECIPKLTGEEVPPTRCLLVPKDFNRVGGRFVLELTVRKGSRKA